jgi:predicted dehydrogenase
MDRKKVVAGFIGSGGIARAHAFAINSLRYYYNNSPEIKTEAVCSASEKSRSLFADQYGFSKALSVKDFVRNNQIDTVYILSPNRFHFEHLEAAIRMSNVKRIYIEKPVCSTLDEEVLIGQIAEDHPEIKIQTGFQFHFIPAIGEAMKLWVSGKLGNLVHFDLKYYHGDYLQKEYRNKRTNRLTPAPDGGAMADLGSHAISLAVGFFGMGLNITGAIQSGNFDEVPTDSDLYSLITLIDTKTNAAGTVAASRISSGTGDLLSMELYAEKGSLRFSSHTPDYYEYFLEETGTWSRIMTGSNYKPFTSFPSGHVPAGWLRSMIHAHYVFLSEENNESFVPDLTHGLAVQRLVRETAEKLTHFRKSRK